MPFSLHIASSAANCCLTVNQCWSLFSAQKQEMSILLFIAQFLIEVFLLGKHETVQLSSVGSVAVAVAVAVVVPEAPS